jgi:pyruvate ferredoxin oxidoreductase beta subunit/2-oxoisovalerate ferredoxin oxidoreductase beta subunit
LKALGKKSIAVVIPGCTGIISGTSPYTSMGVPAYHAALEVAAPTAGGIAYALNLKGRSDITVVAFGGDGGTFDIGLQALSGCCDRNEDFLYVCLDNEAYMNTGIQSSSSTPSGAWTMTTPTGRRGRKKRLMDIIAAHSIPYAATACIGFPKDLMEKVDRAKQVKGTRFIHTLTPCPTGWRMAEDLTAKAGILAVETNIFPLYEIIHGEEYRITHNPQGLPVSEYMKIQGRYRQMSEEQIDEVQKEVDKGWKTLVARARGIC